ncbi:EamA family transporter [Velocimicrobium porci]|uniref:EamA family transporter n=1 Tax=Velocimicrobium porci TaxID=2606634 RepID=A0A6L5Y2A0_9FIRM|nr:EamA family transporter [Velocimicrobium porci]MSS64233.1 EamA family transporter [Velocimicrobium porci]
MWLLFAIGSAFFAGITSIFAKIGIKDIDSHLCTALRTIVVVIFSWLMVFVTGAASDLSRLSLHTLIFLCLSGVTTGASWLCYFKALQIGDVNKVVPIDKSSTVLTVILAILFFHEPISIMKVLSIALIGAGTYLMIEKKQQTQNERKGWLAYALLSAVFASLTSILGKIGIENIDSNLGTAIRTIVVLIMAWLIVFLQKKHTKIKEINKKSWFFILLSGFATGLSWLCYYRALQDGIVSIIVPIDKLSILVTVLFSYIVFHEKLSKKSFLGLVWIIAGTLGMIM